MAREDNSKAVQPPSAQAMSLADEVYTLCSLELEVC